jgi:hypothetical protein
MKITVRIPTEQFAYVEVEFDTIEEYREKYAEFTRTMLQTRKEALKAKQEYMENQAPFEGNEFSK